MSRLPLLEARVSALEHRKCCGVLFYDVLPEKGQKSVLYINKTTGEQFIWNGVDFILAEGNNIYSFDGIVTGDRIMDLNDHTFVIQNHTGQAILEISGSDVPDGNIMLKGSNPSGDGNDAMVTLNGSAIQSIANLSANYQGNSGATIILTGAVDSATSEYISDKHQFTGAFYIIPGASAPANASDTGVAGEIRFTSSYVYYCTAVNTWVRAQLSSW